MVHIVIDLEMNPVNKTFKDVRRYTTDEVIEIGAVKLDDDYKQVSDFQCYVRPQYGEITKHITKLTGITQETVADKPLFPEAFQNFMDWIGTWDMTLYSWSNSDLAQFQSECAFKLPEFDLSRLENNWIDLQKAFDNKIGLNSNLALSTALGAMNRNFKGIQHTALADASNTAAILILMQDEEEFRTTMKPIIDLLNPKEMTASIGELFPDLAKLNFDE